MSKIIFSTLFNLSYTMLPPFTDFHDTDLASLVWTSTASANVISAGTDSETVFLLYPYPKQFSIYSCVGMTTGGISAAPLLRQFLQSIPMKMKVQHTYRVRYGRFEIVSSAHISRCRVHRFTSASLFLSRISQPLDEKALRHRWCLFQDSYF